MSVPIVIGRDEARRAAQEELRKAIYQDAKPTPFERWLERLTEFIDKILSATEDTTVSGWVGIAVLVALVVLVVVLIWRRAGTVQRTQRRARAALLETGGAMTAAEQRAAATRHAGSEEWAEAIRARMRAIALGLEERALLDRRPGRTADEVATDAARSLPGHVDELRAAARIFDDVWYGGRSGSRTSYDEITRVDERVRDAKPALATATAGAGCT
ncbi:MAG: DUF4129 domain-containing protein [Streptosporangiales bacterium]|nr:DUF4129 domain-containing protein [Streptosporangiales bacterium]